MKLEPRKNSRFDALLLQKLGPGKYRLALEDSTVRVTVHAGEYWGGGEESGFIRTHDRILENEQKPAFLQIADVKATKEGVEVSLKGHSEYARVHAFAFHFLPKHLPSSMAGLQRVAQQSFQHAQFPFAMWKNFFLSNRQLGDELRYVFDRKNLPRFTGNTLDRPKMLVKRNYLRDTSFAEEVL